MTVEIVPDSQQTIQSGNRRSGSARRKSSRSMPSLPTSNRRAVGWRLAKRSNPGRESRRLPPLFPANIGEKLVESLEILTE
jgi:hypothetical protein